MLTFSMQNRLKPSATALEMTKLKWAYTVLEHLVRAALAVVRNLGSWVGIEHS